MSTIIKVRCTDQVLTFENTPVIASGGLEEDFVSFEFCGKWDGLVKTAVFWRSEEDVYHVLLDEADSCPIPREVLAVEGVIYFGVFGVNEAGKQRTSEVLRYNVVKGAITEGTKPTDPTPDIYTKILAEFLRFENEIAADLENHKTTMSQAWAAYQASLNQDWETYRTAIGQAWSDYQAEMNQQWQDFKIGGDFVLKTDYDEDQAPVQEHIANQNNPHNVTAEQIGAAKVSAVGNLHVWEKKGLVAEAGYTLGDLETVNITHGAGSNYSSGNFSSWVYSDEISVDEQGVVSLVNPTQTNDLYYNAYSSANVLAGKYAQINPNISPTNSLAKLGSVYFFPAGNSASRNTDDGSYNITLPGKIVSGYPSVFAKDFLTSTDQNAYPEGTVDNTTITYLGCLGEKTQMAHVYYIGTGIATRESNPLSLTFPFPPKIVLYVGRYEAWKTTNSSTNQYFCSTSSSYTRESCHILMDVLTSSYKNNLGFGYYSSSYPRAKKSNDGKTVYWYAISTNDNPGNDSGVRYDYIAIG